MRARSLKRAQLIGLLLAACPVFAHHSGAMFEGQKTLALQGTVKNFQWSNPHCWIQLLVPGPEAAGEWSIEMGSTTQLFRSGWRPGTLQAGQTVMVLVHPARDGSLGGLFVSAAGPDGAALGAAGKVAAP